MNAPALRIPNAGPLAIRSFTAWRLSSTGTSHPLDVSAADTLDEVLSTVAPQCFHKEVFHVVERDEIARRSTLHAYVIKQSARVYRVAPGDVHPTWQTPLRAVLLYSMVIAAFEPVEPWRVMPGCDVVGLDGVIEGRVS